MKKVYQKQFIPELLIKIPYVSFGPYQCTHVNHKKKSDKNNRKLFEITNYSVACLESAQITYH